jgi:FkbM family methyltransferase
MKELKQIFSYINKHPLAGRHKLRAYYQFFYWQISQFLKPREVAVPFVGTTKLIAKKGLAGATGNIYTGLHEFTDMSFLLHFLRKDDVFADIGANIGSYTVLAAGCIEAETYSFEPIPETFNWLVKNIKVNGLQNKVNAQNIGLGSVESKTMFTTSFDTVNHVIADHEKNSTDRFIEVQIKPFDLVLEGNQCPALIKIDVEGFETEVIKGMQQTLKNNIFKAIIIELNGSGRRYGYNEELIHIELLNNGFSSYVYDPFKRKLLPVEHFGSHNTIYVRDINFVNQRILSAPKITVFSESF